MSYQSNLYSALIGESTISAIVGTAIFPDIADGTVAPPYIIYQTISTGGETSHDGVRNVEFPLIQLSCWTTGRATVIALASAVNAFLDGNLIAGASAVTFQFSNQLSSYDLETKLYGEILEYSAASNTN
jgi:hypothetical protein